MEKHQFLNKIEELKSPANAERWVVLQLWLVEAKSDEEIAKDLDKNRSTATRKIGEICKHFGTDAKGKKEQRQYLVLLFRMYCKDFEVHPSIYPDWIDGDLSDRPQSPTNLPNIPTLAPISELTTLEFIGRNHPSKIDMTESPENTYQTWSQIGREDNHNLPLAQIPNQIYGRENELDKLLRYLKPECSIQVIRVTGIGGVGKTTLALEAACRCLGYKRYQNNYESCLETIPHFDYVIFSSAKEIRINPTGYVRISNPSRNLIQIFKDISRFFKDDSIMIGKIPDIQEKICQKLSENRVLLILDNFETITDEENVNSFLEDLTFKAQKTKVVITSRKTFKGSCNVDIPELSQKQAFELLDNESKHLSCSSSEITDRQKIIIYDTVGGIPLAIKYIVGMLSTQHVYQFSLESLLKKLAGKSGEGLLPFVFAEAINNMNRNDTYKLLLATAIFPNQPFELKTILIIANMADKDQDDIWEHIDELICLSFVFEKKEGRYSMLPLTQKYCLMELRNNLDMQKEYYERRFLYYKTFVQEYCAYKENNIERIRNYNKVDSEWGNILAIVRWCKDTNDYGRVKELWFLVNNYANLKGYWRDRLYWLGYILKNAKRMSDYKSEAKAQMNIARTRLLQGTEQELQEAKSLLEDAWKKREYLDACDIDYITNHFAGLYLRLGDYPQAHYWLKIEQYKLDEDISIDNSQRIKYQLYIHREKADVLFHQGEYDEAKKLCLQIIHNENFNIYIRSINYIRRILAEIYIIDGDMDNAEQQLYLGFQEVESNDDKRRIGYYNASFARLEIKLGDLSISLDEKRRHYDKAEEYASKAMSAFSNLSMERNHNKVKNEIMGIIKTKRQELRY